MKKRILYIAVIFLYAGYIAYQKINSSAAPLVVPPKLSQLPAIPNLTDVPSAPSPVVPAAPAPTPAPAPAPASTPVPKPKGLYADGQYTGSVTDAYYGNVQVQVTISGSKIAGVKFLDYPQDRSTSRAINSQAMPYLIQEALQTQSANVDVISGATFTSQAFVQSLASALTKAKNA